MAEDRPHQSQVGPEAPQPARGIEQYRLENGYTEFSVEVHPNLPFPTPTICAACGRSLEPDCAGASHEFRAGEFGVGGPLSFIGMQYLCTGCVSHGLLVTDFVRIGFTDGGRLLVQVGNWDCALAWRTELKGYCGLYRKVAGKVLGKNAEVFLRDEDLLHEVSRDPVEAKWVAPLKEGDGCLLVFMAVAALVATAVASSALLMSY